MIRRRRSKENIFREQRSSEEEHTLTSSISLPIKLVRRKFCGVISFHGSNKLLPLFSHKGGQAPALGWRQSSEELHVFNLKIIQDGLSLPGLAAVPSPDSHESSCSAWHVLGPHHHLHLLPNPTGLNPQS